MNPQKLTNPQFTWLWPSYKCQSIRYLFLFCFSTGYCRCYKQLLLAVGELLSADWLHQKRSYYSAGIQYCLTLHHRYFNGRITEAYKKTIVLWRGRLRQFFIQSNNVWCLSRKFNRNVIPVLIKKTLKIKKQSPRCVL